MLLPIPSKLPAPGTYQNWTSTHGAAQALALIECCQLHRCTLLMLCTDNQQLQRIQAELQFFMQNDPLPLLVFPDRETLPYDRFSPHQDIQSERIATLCRMPEMQHGLILASINAALTRLPPVGYLTLQAKPLVKGERIAVNSLRKRLDDAGYRAVETVYGPGEFAVRGAILDLYPIGSSQPVRIEFFDDEIDSIRTFDPQSQRSANKVDQIDLLPARECPLDATARQRFRRNWEQHLENDPRPCPLYQDVQSGLHSPGLEYFLPLFFDRTSTFLEYLPSKSMIVTVEDILVPMRSYWNEIERRYEERLSDRLHPLLPPHLVFLPEEEFNHHCKKQPRIRMSVSSAMQPTDMDLGTHPSPDLPVQPGETEAFLALRHHLNRSPRPRILIQCETAGRRESLREHLQSFGLSAEPCSSWQEFLESSAPLAISLGMLDRGFITDPIEIISETQLFGTKVMQRRHRRRSHQDFQEELALRSLVDLTPGCPMVHQDHGIGRYHGLVVLEIDGQAQEFLLLTYADEAKLYVPVIHLQKIARYAGHSPEHAPLHRLGSDQWSKARRQAAEKIHDVAAEILDIHARRAARSRQPCIIDSIEYERFAAGFPFEETADQAAAIEATLNDMTRSEPMDRLICGDVGFGKTEVAMRAAFVAILNNHQVAVLVPTTLLAQQHYETFRDRFADWPVRIEVLSRFRSQRDIQQTLIALAKGQIDIVIGTHKLLQADINFARLGLMIVDEEHRFGVKHKEALKKLRAEVDMLTLTATPIPRTLNMALSGLRELSIIATAPNRRLSIRTFVREHESALIKEAILRELLRGGQVYYLHNDVSSIGRCAENLALLVPEARIGVAHGQMRERELESIMQQFYHKQFNVLVCTTIIETGIDIPSANTMIIDRADKLGLAQLHQLRGRVGRSHHQAYAYLLTPDSKSLTPDAQKRLEALERAQELGSGFVLASEDLEIRGAGELLGEEQSGSMDALGYSMYMDMLERAVKAIREGRTPQADQPFELHSDIQLRIPALIPDDYLPDVPLRLQMYKRIISADRDERLHEIKVEMIDRFGLCPPPLLQLFDVQKLRFLADQLGIRKIDGHSQGGRIEFGPETRVDPSRLIRLIQNSPGKFKIEGGNTLKIIQDLSDPKTRIDRFSQLLQELKGP